MEDIAGEETEKSFSNSSITAVIDLDFLFLLATIFSFSSLIDFVVFKSASCKVIHSNKLYNRLLPITFQRQKSRF